MKQLLILSMAITCLLSCKDKTINMSVKYPDTKKVDSISIHFGDTISDPYRWLEDDNSNETKAWVKSQNEVTFDYLKKIPYRDQLKKRMEEIWNFEKIWAPTIEGNYTYFYKNNGLQNQNVLYRKDKENKESVFLDPNSFSKDGSTSLDAISFTKDGSLMAYSISEAGSDWRKVIVFDTQNKKRIGDTITNVKFSGISWYKNIGFYYSSYDKPEGSQLTSKTDQHKLYFHKLGTSQKEDQVVFGLKEKRRYVSGYTTEDERYLIITAANSTTGNELYYKDLSINGPIINIVNNFESNNYVLDNEGSKFYVATNYKAPNNRVVSFSLDKSAQEHWINCIPETENVLQASSGGGFFFAEYMINAISIIKQFDYNGKFLRDIPLDGLGTASGIGGKKDDKTLYYTFTNYITPSTIYSYDPNSGISKVFQQPKVDFKRDNFESKQVFYTSKDGTKIPMMITYKKGTNLNGKNPTLLYGYGGFNISITPEFSVSKAVWIENGGIYAVPNIRGGGEYGKKWHDAGTQMHKQNVFDDFIAAAEYLIAQKYTSSDYLAISGRSNGGLLVGATMTQRPDLMKVALPGVGVLDMLRYHTFTAGAGWSYDYGTANQSKEMFQYLKGYSPVHQVKKEVKYPATLITTGDHDDRVVPAHSFKFAAELQAKQSGPNPVLIRIDVNTGHGAGKSVASKIQEEVDCQVFTLFNMGIKELAD